MGSCSVQFFATPCTALCQASLSFSVSWSLLKFMSITPVMLSNHLNLCHPLLLPSIFPSIRVFSNELTLHIQWPKYWSFSLNISPSNEYSGLISFRTDWYIQYVFSQYWLMYWLVYLGYLGLADIFYICVYVRVYRASLVAQTIRNPPAMQETWIWSLSWEDPLEKEMATHSVIPAWRIPWTEEPGGL